jgi:hypothetical protein
VDINVIKSFLNQRLPTRESMEHAASLAGISVATLYRYKSNPESISLGVLAQLTKHLGLPLANGAAWARTEIVAAEHRRLALETHLASVSGRRCIIVAPYTVNDELPEITRMLVENDYGTKARELVEPILEIRMQRAKLYNSQKYDSWEIWNGHGYSDFLLSRGRYQGLSNDLKNRQIAIFKESSVSRSKRFFYIGSDLPTFGCYSEPKIALLRIEDIHLEFQDVELVESFEDTFNDLVRRCATRTHEEFVSLLYVPIEER